ncbi:MAG: ATP-binding cassette domain-containing protein [Granulosicoccus sp.]
MLSLNDVACRRDGAVLFEQVDLTIHAGQKVGLTGANGTGKSSLFAMIQGALDPDHGAIQLQQQVGITHVAQETVTSSRSALDFVIDGDQRVRGIESAIAGCDDNDGVRHATLLGDLEQADGWTVHSRAGALLNGLGFSSAQHDWPVNQFSGGWRMRLNLGQALMSPAELLLLDEPTNHLDLDAVIWLEQWLKQRQGALILISHDREFLDAVTTHTMHIEAQRVELVTGNYSAFERWRTARLANQQAVHIKQTARRKELEAFVTRFRAKATKARQAQSRLKMLERMGQTEAARVDTPFSFVFREPRAMPSPLVALQQANIGYGDSTILQQINLSIQSGERIGLLGANGAGKSTLVKAIVGDLALQSGERMTAQKLDIGYFAQHQVDQLSGEHSPLQALQKQAPKISDAEARNFLGGFGFHGDQALQVTATLSGGERARLALALIVYARPNLLLLDEPTNHLDIDMRQALADALLSFEGALLVISHDRIMLRSVVDELLLVADTRVVAFKDDLDGYARWLAKRRKQAAGGDVSALQQTARTEKSGAIETGLPPETAGGVETVVKKREHHATRKNQKRNEAGQRSQLRPLRKAIERDERKLEAANQSLSVLREKLSAADLYNEDSKNVLAELLAGEGEARSIVDDAEIRLLDSMQALEAAENATGES